MVKTRRPKMGGPLILTVDAMIMKMALSLVCLFEKMHEPKYVIAMNVDINTFITSNQKKKKYIYYMPKGHLPKKNNNNNNTLIAY